MNNALADQFAWNQQAQQGDPSLYGFQQRTLNPADLYQYRDILMAQGKWDPSWDAYLNQTLWNNNPDAVQIAGPSMAALDGTMLGEARGQDRMRLQQLYDANGNPIDGTQRAYEGGGGAWKADDWRNAIGTVAGVLAAGYGASALAGGAAGGAAAGTAGAYAAGDIGAAAAAGSGGTAGAMANGALAGGATGAGMGSATAAGYGGLASAGGAMYADAGGGTFSDAGTGGTASGSGSLSTSGQVAAPELAQVSQVPSMSINGASPWYASLNNPNTYGQLAQAGIGLYAINRAAAAQQAGLNQNNALAQQTMQQQQANAQPWLTAGAGALDKINALLKDPSSVANEPGYQFGLREGQKQLDNRAAAGGGYYSGAQLKAANRYGQDYASTKLDQSYNRLANIAGLGQVGMTQTNAALGNYGQTVGNNLSTAGNVRGSSYMGAANMLGSALGNIGNNWQQQQYFDQYGAPWGTKKPGG